MTSVNFGGGFFHAILKRSIELDEFDFESLPLEVIDNTLTLVEISRSENDPDALFGELAGGLLAYAIGGPCNQSDFVVVFSHVVICCVVLREEMVQLTSSLVEAKLGFMASKNDGDELLTVGEISRRSGIAVSAIHFYESKKLVRSVRDGRNQRRFSRRELRILAFIKVAQRLGFSLDEIQQAFRDLPEDRVPTKSDWQKVSRAWQGALVAKIALATKLHDQLSLCIGCGCLSMKDCPLRNPGDELAGLGAGPRLL